MSALQIVDALVTEGNEIDRITAKEPQLTLQKLMGLLQQSQCPTGQPRWQPCTHISLSAHALLLITEYEDR